MNQACFLVAVALISWCFGLSTPGLAAGHASTAGEDQREQVRREVADLDEGARIVETDRGAVLVATATVALSEKSMSPAEAFAHAAAAALIEARAEGALFLAGEYSGTKESGRDAVSANGKEVLESWIKTHAASTAKARLTSGEPIECSRAEGGARVVVAWGLARSTKTAERYDEQSLGSLADEALAASERPSCDLRWITDADGREGLCVVIAIFPDGPLGACAKGAAGGGCTCVSCRKRVLDLKVQRTVAEWSREGDVGVARTLTRVSKRTQTLAKDGTAALQRFSERHATSKSKTTVSAVIPPDFFAKSTFAYRHADGRSVCVGFVPIGAVPAAAKDGGP